MRQSPGGQIADGHDKRHRDQKGNEQSAKSVADKLASAFARQGWGDEDAAYQEHQRHEEDVVKVFEDIEAF